MSDARDDEVARSAGRPRDDSVDRKIVLAAIEIYAERGWGKFTFDAVASHAGVGKPAIYRRYDSREDLLISSFQDMYLPIPEVNTGSLRGDLTALAVTLFEFWLSPVGSATLRMSADQVYMPEIGETYHARVVRPMILAARAIVDRGKERGEIDRDLDTNMVLEVIAGATRTRVTDTRMSARPRLYGLAESYADGLVDFLL